MSSTKALKLWILNVISFILFVMMSTSGLVNWLILPRGHGVREGILVSVRHFLISVHQWTALIFIAVIVVHVSFHWAYLKTNLKRYGVLK